MQYGRYVAHRPGVSSGWWMCGHFFFFSSLTMMHQHIFLQLCVILISSTPSRDLDHTSPSKTKSTGLINRLKELAQIYYIGSTIIRSLFTISLALSMSFSFFSSTSFPFFPFLPFPKFLLFNHSLSLFYLSSFFLFLHLSVFLLGFFSSHNNTLAYFFKG